MTIKEADSRPVQKAASDFQWERRPNMDHNARGTKKRKITDTRMQYTRIQTITIV